MSLTTEEIIGGMYRAHQAGQPFAALVANPQFANLPLEEKKQVLAGFRHRVGSETTSPVNTLTNIVKGTAGGAAAGIPIGMAVPLALEMSQSGATKKSVLAALRMAAQNPHVKMLVGTGMALGAAGGMINTALGMYQAKKDHEQLQTDLDEATQGGESLAAASFGAIGGHRAPRRVNLDTVIKTFRDTATPYATASARYGHYGTLVDELDADKYADIVHRAHQKAVDGQEQSPQGLKDLATKLAKARGYYQNLDSLVVNSHREMHMDPTTVDDTREEIGRLHAKNEETLETLRLLEAHARQVRDTKRGTQ